ncbi:head-tail adaptor [Bacillus phage BCASJ1c]|uniref:42 n=1 Tax=Bacillus phage BCASJ1c TaxID=294382 RepID=Q5YA68_9CAUD|nr:head-tail adaptor [Bacillus phage BCASJ1c]AAU85089.1 42 [Bacillus phage BCASJ1c]
MPYLTYEEFMDLNGRDIDDKKFEKLLPKASAIIDGVTGHFYQKVDMEKDNAWRVNQFKLALCAQIEYFDALGATTFEEINNSPQTFQAGRTSVSNASRYNPSGANESKPLVAEDVYIYLQGTGLLFQGVKTW